MKISLDAANALEGAIDGKIKRAAAPRRRASGTVSRVDKDGTVYAVLESGIETVVEGLTASVNPGDTVSVTVEDGHAEVLGNYTDPSAGVKYVRAVEGIATEAGATAHAAVDSAAAARQVADEAQKVAEATNQHFFADTNGAHTTDVTQDEWNDAVADNFSDYDPTTKPYHNQLLNSLGILLRTALNNLVSITRSAIAFYDGTGNAASNIVARFGSDGAQIGKSNAAHSVIDADGQRFYGGTNGATQLANIGYGDGEAQSGTTTAPYYTFGTRKTTTSVYVPSTTYNVGDHVLYEGVEYVCNTTHTWHEWTPSRWNLVIGAYSNANGTQVTASGLASHAEGSSASAVMAHDHAEGVLTIAYGGSSHAEGWSTKAAGNASHAEGEYTYASGSQSHAEGSYTSAYGSYSHAQNKGTIARSEAQTAMGRYNVEDANGDYALIIGNGTADDARSNALAVRWDGDIDFGTSGDHRFIFENTDTSKPTITHWRIVFTGYGNLRLDSSSDGGATWTNGVKYFAAENRTWPVENGGTGATNANDAHKNLGITAGSVSVEATANTYKDVSISFGKTYTSAPTVVVGFYSTSTAVAFGGLTVAVHSITTTGCKARVFNNTSSNRSPGVHWVAVGS